MEAFLDKRQGSSEQLNCWGHSNHGSPLCKEVQPLACAESKQNKNETKALDDGHFGQISQVCSTRQLCYWSNLVIVLC